MLAEKHIRDAIVLLATIDPIGTLLVFVAITAAAPLREESHSTQSTASGRSRPSHLHRCWPGPSHCLQSHMIC